MAPTLNALTPPSPKCHRITPKYASSFRLGLQSRTLSSSSLAGRLLWSCSQSPSGCRFLLSFRSLLSTAFPLHFCYPGAIQHPVLKSAQDCFQGCRPTFRGVGETLCHTGGEGLLGTRTDGTLTVVVGQLLKDRGRPQSPGSLATEVASAPSRSPSQHQADGQRRWSLGPGALVISVLGVRVSGELSLWSPEPPTLQGPLTQLHLQVLSPQLNLLKSHLGLQLT